MKKILLTIVITAFAFCANAKTIQELAKEYQALRDSGQTQWQASQAVYSANLADMATVFEVWKNSNSAKFQSFESPLKDFTVAQKNESLAIRAIMAHYLIATPAKMKNAPARTVYLACPSKCVVVLSVGNSNLYENLKSADFVVDGIQLPAYARIHIAISARDFDYITGLSIADGLQSPDAYLPIKIESLLNSSDIEASKAICREIENYFINKKIFNSPYLSQIQAVGKILTARLVDQKISGK